MATSRSPSQLELDLPLPSRGEAPRLGAQEVEVVTATTEPESPACTNYLMEAICASDNIEAAVAAVVRNKGAPGIDGITVKQLPEVLKARWPEMKRQLLQGRYQPQPVRRVTIPKPAGGTRNLGIPTVIDRVIQQAVLQRLQPLWDPTFSEHSFGFRPGRSAHQAVAQAQAYVIDGYRFVVDIDLAQFFDRVNHDRLMAAVAARVSDRRVLRLIRSYLTAGVLDNGLFESSREGAPQGGPLSPLLSNLVLDELDRELERRGHRFVRYADDCAPRRREEVRDVTSNSWQPCCTRDEGRPLGLGLQDQGPNHRKPRRSNGRGGERCGKRRDQSRQVCAGQTNASEPLLTCRKRRDVAKTRLQLLACDKARREPADWPSGDRHEDGVRPARGSCAERGNLSPRCEGRPPRGRPPRSRVPMRGAGADGFVVPSKPGNAGGGKGPDTPADETGQPAMGGAGV
jgi:retron-type reverse transcriptase